MSSRRPKTQREHLMVPDTQVKEGVPTNHLSALGNYAAHKQPDVIVIIGDWWDLPSLSAWDSSATKVAEKRFYLKAGSSRGDVEAGNDAMADFLKRVHKKRSYRPEIHFLFGNHEDRITRRLRESPELGEAISLDHLKTPGVKRHPYLHPICIDGVWYCHFFCMDSNGRVMNSKRGQSSAKAQVKNFGESCVAGHRQGLDVAIWESPAGRKRGVIAGSCYQHSESFLTAQGNAHWRGALYMHNVRNGDYDLMEISLAYLVRKWG